MEVSASDDEGPLATLSVGAGGSGLPCTADVSYLPDISELVSFVLIMTIGFGLVFELPVVLFVLGMVRIISSRWLYKRRPYWFLALAIVANFLTPGVDPLTPMIMFVPLYIFFEATALLLKLLGR